MKMIGRKKKRKEKRSCHRIGVYHLMKYRLLSKEGNGGPYCLASVSNISGSGACIDTGDLLPAGAVIQALINFPRINGPVPVLAKVIWTRKSRGGGGHLSGLHFTEIDQLNRRQMIELIDLTRGSNAKNAGKR